MTFLEGTEDGSAKELRKFEIERFYGQHEFTAPHQLSCSDCEPTNMETMMKLLDEQPIEIKNLWNNMTFHYTETQGHPKLRQEVAAFYTNISPDDVLVCCPEEGIFLFMNYFIKEGDEVIVTWPAYQSLYEVARSKGAKIKQWSCEVAKGSEEPIFSIAALKKLISKETKLLVMNFPHNPTGFIPTKEEYKEIVKLCEENDCFIFSDEMYRRFFLDEKYNIPSAAEQTSNCVVLSGMSKLFGLPGIRIGWLIVQDKEMMKHLLELKDYTSICPPAPSEILAIIGLRNKELLIEKNLQLIKTNVENLRRFCEEFPKFKFYQPRGSSICFIRIEDDDVDKYVNDLINNHGIVLAPGSVFTAEKSHMADRARFGLGRIDFGSVLDKLRTIVSAQK